MEKQDLIEVLKNDYDRFSKGQKEIARYIIENYDKAAFMTAGTLGKTVGISESTVVRFACALGYEGYPQLQKHLQELIKNKLTTVQRLNLKMCIRDRAVSGIEAADSIEENTYLYNLKKVLEKWYWYGEWGSGENSEIHGGGRSGIQTGQ